MRMAATEEVADSVAPLHRPFSYKRVRRHKAYTAALHHYYGFITGRALAYHCGSRWCGRGNRSPSRHVQRPLGRSRKSHLPKPPPIPAADVRAQSPGRRIRQHRLPHGQCGAPARLGGHLPPDPPLWRRTPVQRHPLQFYGPACGRATGGARPRWPMRHSSSFIFQQLAPRVTAAAILIISWVYGVCSCMFTTYSYGPELPRGETQHSGLMQRGKSEGIMEHHRAQKGSKAAKCWPRFGANSYRLVSFSSFRCSSHQESVTSSVEFLTGLDLRH